MNLYDFLTSTNLVEYWINRNVNKQPPVGETLFPYKNEIGTKLEWIKGANNQVVGIRLSAYDSKAIRRNREGFEVNDTKMPFFKESMVVDEDMRSQLNTLIQTNNQELINRILSRIFDDQIKLIQACFETLEIMRMQLLTTGIISLASNGQSYTYDYGMPADNKKTVTKAWSDPSADIIKDINDWKMYLKTKGYTATRAMCNSTVVKYMMQNTAIKNAVYVMANGTVTLTSERALAYIEAETGLSIYVNDDVYKKENGEATKYFADDIFVMFPEGDLGYTHIGVTPEESDLMTSPEIAKVSIVNPGIAVTTSKIVDPVNVENKVSMVALPSFEMADAVVIADLTP